VDGALERNAAPAMPNLGLGAAPIAYLRLISHAFGEIDWRRGHSCQTLRAGWPANWLRHIT
jgi:hypothetical protein